MLVNVLILVLGLGLIIKGGDWFVGASVRIAEWLRMPRVVIGSTLVSWRRRRRSWWCRSWRAVRASRAGGGQCDRLMHLQRGLILGVTAALKRVEVHLRVLRVPLIALFGFAALLFVMMLDLSLSRWRGAVLVAGGLAYFVTILCITRASPKPRIRGSCPPAGRS